MGVPTSEVGYTIATSRRETTKVHTNMWWQWGENILKPLSCMIRFQEFRNSRQLLYLKCSIE